MAYWYDIIFSYLSGFFQTHHCIQNTEVTYHSIK